MIREKEREKRIEICSLGAHYILFCCSFSLCVRCCLWVIVVEMFLALFIFIMMIMCTHTYGAVCVIWTIVLFLWRFFFGERKIFFFIRWLLFCFLIRKNNKTFLHIYFIFFLLLLREEKKKRIHYIICRVADVEKSRTQKSPRHLIRLYILYIKLYERVFFLSFFSFFYFYYYF
jgi:hypothetical protein